MSLYHKYRPNKISEMVGNDEVLSVLEKDIAKKDPPRSYLFHGPSGTGKTTLARIVCRELGVADSGLKEIDSGSYRGIDVIREIQQQAKYSPIDGQRRAWILDEVQQMTQPGMSALLKILEDTPDHVIFCLATTDPQKLTQAIRGRCAQYKTSQLTEKEARDLLCSIVEAEGEELEDRVLEYVIGDDRRPRDMVQNLERVLSVEEDRRLDVAKRLAVGGEKETIDLCRMLLKGSPWADVKKVVSDLRGEDPERVRRAVMGYCSAVLLKSGNDRAFEILDVFSKPFYDNGFNDLVLSCYIVSKR